MTIKERNQHIFPILKSIVSDCICNALHFIDAKISEISLNMLSNEYADKILLLFDQEMSKNLERIKEKIDVIIDNKKHFIIQDITDILKGEK